MDPKLRESTLRYYDERAADYDDSYLLGTGTSSITDPDVFQREAQQLAEVVRAFAGGRLLDVACGTAFWLPHYIGRTSEVTLFDQSAPMLEQCRQRVEALGVASRCTFLQGDVLNHQFEKDTYDRTLVGFLISHLTPTQEETVFALLRRTLRPSGRFLILESAWTPQRAAVNQKTEEQARPLKDGTTLTIYKRYLDRTHIEGWRSRFGGDLQVEYFGDAFAAVSGSFR